MNKQIDLNYFLELPDWKKIQLKMTQSKFNNYPIQTVEQEYDRRMSILKICSYFAMSESFNEFMNVLSKQSSLNGFWPIAMELFITPQLLDIIPYYKLLEFCNCYCCENFIGHNNNNYRIKNSKIIPLFGICKQIEESNVLNRVNPDQRCISWNPLKMYEQIIDYRIKKVFAQNKIHRYDYEDYKKDLQTINLWDFFQNNYKSIG